MILSSTKPIVPIGWKYIPWAISTAMVAILFKLGAFQPLEYFAYNRFTNLRSDRHWDERLVIIAIDDVSIEKLGRFPWSRDRYIPIIQKLTKAGASTITINLLWSESSPTDTQLAQAITANQRVVLAQAWGANGKQLQPVPILAESAIGTGQIVESKDSDGIVRQTHLYMEDTPSLAMATLQAYNLVQGTVPMPDPNLSYGINWLHRPQKMRQYSFVDVLENRISQQNFQNKIVLIGLTATGSEPLITPFDQAQSTYGVHLHATILQNLLQQNALRVLPEHWNWGVILLGGTVIAWVMRYSKTLQQFATLLILVGGWGICAFLSFSYGYWIPIAMPIALIMTIGVSSIIQRQIETKQHLQQINSKLAYDAFHDNLTGLANRNLLNDRIEHAISLYQRHGYLFALILLDMDGFKAINDNLGHLIGDRLLIEVSQRLCASVRMGDTVARLGGDEFVILLENLKERQDAIITAERIQASMEPTCRLAEQDIKISISMGMAFSVESYHSPKEILVDADIAMYRAKSMGKSCYQIFDLSMQGDPKKSKDFR
jgi:diguanylate cyclase (GGDEF)-like protein